MPPHPSTQGAPTLPLSHSNSPYCGGGACTRVHLRSLRGEDVHIENLAIGVEELAQLLVAAAGRDAADEELVLGVGDATVARVHRRVGEAHLQRVAQGRQGTLIVQRVDGRLRRDEGRVLHEAAALVHVGATIAQDDDLDDLAILREDCGRECGPHQGGQRRQGEKRWGGRASAAKGVQLRADAYAHAARRASHGRKGVELGVHRVLSMRLQACAARRARVRGRRDACASGVPSRTPSSSSVLGI